LPIVTYLRFKGALFRHRIVCEEANMESLLVNILFVAGGALVGALGGWFIRASNSDFSFLPAATPKLRPNESPTAKQAAPEKGLEQVETIMSRLHQLTVSVAADVDEHNTRVQAISNELSSGGDVVSIVERLVEVNEQMQSQLQAAEKRLQTQASEIESHVREARTDALTKLANRRAFDDEIQRCVHDFCATGKPSCVMMIDVDHFKKFNDTYGHQAGDEVLKGVARVLRRELATNEVVCRYGGEEFAVIFPGMELNAVIPRAEKGRSALAREVFEFQGLDLRVTASGGLAQLQPSETGEQLVKRADDSLYVCKENGRNCGYWHDGKVSHPMNNGLTRSPVSQVTSATHNHMTSVSRATPAIRMADDESRFADESDEKVVFKLVPVIEEPKFDRRDRIAGLTDRDTFYKDIERRLAEQQKTGVPTSIMLIEMDRFQEMVDGFGGKAAELALRAGAQILKVTMREMDHAARYDQAVFGLLLPGASLAEAGAIAERMRVAIENCKVPCNGEQLRFTVSIGAAEAFHGEKQSSVIERVTQALEAAKSYGGNTSLAISDAGEPCPMAMAT
jgi:diguanylate cyclase